MNLSGHSPSLQKAPDIKYYGTRFLLKKYNLLTLILEPLPTKNQPYSTDGLLKNHRQ